MNCSRLVSCWAQVHNDLIETVERFGENELSFVPFEGSWPIGQIALHIADCEDNWIHGVVRQEIVPWVLYDLEEYPTKAAIVEVINRTQEKTNVFLSNLRERDLDRMHQTPEGQTFRLSWIIWHVLEHEIHHRGELSLIHGLLGRAGLDV